MSYDDQDFESSKKTSSAVDAEDDPFESGSSRPAKKYEDSGESDLTVYVGGVPFDSTSQDIENLFKDCGDVSSVRMPTYPDSGRSRGFAYVVFSDTKGVDAALNLNGTDFMGRSIKVEKSRGKTGGDRADKRAGERGGDRYAARSERSDRGGDRYGGDRERRTGGGDASNENTVFLGNLAFSASEDDIRDAFEDCGSISAIRIPTDRNTGKVRGFGYVSFDSSAGVEKAISKTGVEISGRSVRVDYASGKGGAGGAGGSSGGRGGDRDRSYGSRGGSGGGRYYDRKSDHSSRRYRDEY